MLLLLDMVLYLVVLYSSFLYYLFCIVILINFLCFIFNNYKKKKRNLLWRNIIIFRYFKNVCIGLYFKGYFDSIGYLDFSGREYVFKYYLFF